jgi:hypothetical protein
MYTSLLQCSGDGVEWVAYSVTAWHNRLAPAGLPTYPSSVNSTVQTCGGCGWTSAYTSILPLHAGKESRSLPHEDDGTVADSVVIVYDRCDTELCDQGQDIFAARITLGP